jgi:hypothetical protein
MITSAPPARRLVTMRRGLNEFMLFLEDIYAWQRGGVTIRPTFVEILVTFAGCNFTRDSTKHG